MDRIVECVPNFSEGRNQTTVQALVDAVESVPGVWLLDHTMDRDHHRSVLTFAGEPDAVDEAPFRAIRMATDLIDLRKHKGVHPRVGATDVVPFVPIKGVDDAGLYPSGEAIGTTGRNRAGDSGIPLRTSGAASRSCSAGIGAAGRASRPGIPHGLRSGLDTGFWSCQAA